MAELINLRDHKQHQGFEAFVALLDVVVGSDNPTLAGCYVIGGFAGWLAIHQGVSLDEIAGWVMRGIEAERNTPRA